jgi:hypothetical protein
MEETMEQALLTYEIWHERLAHVGKTRFKALQRVTDIPDLKGVIVPKEKKCKGCILGKQSCKTFPSSTEMKFEPGECVSSDLQGPFEVQSMTGKRYFLGFRDKNSGYVKTFFTRTKTKEEIASILEDFISHNKALTGQDLKVWQTDGGGEFLNDLTDAILKKHNIVRRVTNADTPEENGQSERTNRTMLEGTRAIMLLLGLPKHLLAEVMSTMTKVHNVVPTHRPNGQTPRDIGDIRFEVSIGQIPGQYEDNWLISIPQKNHDW